LLLQASSYLAKQLHERILALPDPFDRAMNEKIALELDG